MTTIMSMHGSARAIDWEAMAEPRDGYDSAVVLGLAAAAGHVRRPVGRAPTICEGRVAIRPLAEYGSPELEPWAEPERCEHPNLDRAGNLLGCWPAGYAQFVALIDTVVPIRDRKVSGKVSRTAARARSALLRGSSSHSLAERFGSLHCTVHDPIGTAQAFVHELAHQKLRALGVPVEGVARLLTNDATPRYPSPMREDELRPFSAIVHATYASQHVCQLDLCLIAHARRQAWGSDIEGLFVRYLHEKLGPLAHGLALVEAHARPNAAGERFFSAMLRWGHALVRAGNEEVDALEVVAQRSSRS